jgi:hypothetical protein
MLLSRPDPRLADCERLIDDVTARLPLSVRRTRGIVCISLSSRSHTDSKYYGFEILRMVPAGLTR